MSDVSSVAAVRRETSRIVVVSFCKKQLNGPSPLGFGTAEPALRLLDMVSDTEAYGLILNTNEHPRR
jgi:hypothetical protein